MYTKYKYINFRSSFSFLTALKIDQRKKNHRRGRKKNTFINTANVEKIFFLIDYRWIGFFWTVKGHEFLIVFTCSLHLLWFLTHYIHNSCNMTFFMQHNFCHKKALTEDFFSTFFALNKKLFHVMYICVDMKIKLYVCDSCSMQQLDSDLAWKVFSFKKKEEKKEKLSILNKNATEFFMKENLHFKCGRQFGHESFHDI